MTNAETFIHAFVSSRPDYCKFLFSNLPSVITKSSNGFEWRIWNFNLIQKSLTQITNSLAPYPCQIRPEDAIDVLQILNRQGPSYFFDLLRPALPDI